jgi:exopolyphosphatase/guanosine-5'-triphosphate,3'-diphosphate pyrophosphatase
MRTACIDIGSNTTRLLVAELAETDPPTLREVTTQRVFTRLRGFDGPIPPEKVAEVAATVASQVRLARESGAGEVRAVATAAIRGATNRDELCAAIHAAAGVPVFVLSGEDEARLAFQGATRTLRHVPDGTVAVVDVGGGSTELVCGSLEGGVQWSASFPVGSGFLADHYVRSDPPAPDELERIRAHADGVFGALDAPRPDAAYAVGGSATSLRRLIGAVLDHETLGRAIRVVCEAPAEEAARRFDLHLERVRVLPAGMLLLDAASTFLKVPLQIAGGGLREGVVLEQLGATSARP